MKTYLTLFLILISLPVSLLAQDKKLGDEQVIYKQIDTTSLSIEVIYPPNIEPDKTYPGIIFFFGGGWNGGSVSHFANHAKYFASRGLVCFLADYRVKQRQRTTPFESLMDAKSAMRFVKKNAERFHLDPDKLIAGGGSAGGHLAAATALIDAYDDFQDDLSISPKPVALILFNPVIDNGPAGYGFERIGEEFSKFSPLHNIRKDAPPTIIFLGTKDKLIPVETMEYYKVAMGKVGSRCELFLYEGQAHGFFNYGKENGKYYKKTVLEADKFLESLGYLKGDPTIMN